METSGESPEIKKEEVYLHPDFKALLERYKTDQRFQGNDQVREQIIVYLTELNEFIQAVEKPPDVQAVLLTGSFSSLKKEPPDLRKPVGIEPRWDGSRRGGSDIDLLVALKSSVSDLIRLKWYQITAPGFEIPHPRDFTINTRRYFKSQLEKYGNQDLIDRVEISAIPITESLKEMTLKEYFKHMVGTGTLLWGDLPLPSYGVYRDNPPEIKRPAIKITGGPA